MKIVTRYFMFMMLAALSAMPAVSTAQFDVDPVKETIHGVEGDDPYVIDLRITGDMWWEVGDAPPVGGSVCRDEGFDYEIRLYISGCFLSTGCK